MCQFILQLPLSRLPWRIIVSLAGRHIRCYNKGKEDDSLQQDENSSDKRPTLFIKTRSTISMQSVCLHKESSIPSRFAPRSPVMRHHQIPCFHYSKRHGQILSMPQHSSYESFHKSVHKGFTDSSFCTPYSQFLLKAEYLPHANHHIHHKKTHPCVS